MIKKLSLTTVITLLASSAFASDVTGVWQTQQFKGPTGGGGKGNYFHVEIVENGTVYDAIITKEFNKDREIVEDSSNVGIKMAEGITFDKAKGGKFYHPFMKKTFSSKGNELATENILSVKGCIGPFCMTRAWSRVK